MLGEDHSAAFACAANGWRPSIRECQSADGNGEFGRVDGRWTASGQETASKKSAVAGAAGHLDWWTEGTCDAGRLELRKGKRAVSLSPMYPATGCRLWT